MIRQWFIPGKMKQYGADIKIVRDADCHQIQRFISKFPWSARGVMDSVAMQTRHSKSGYTKKVVKSVGVARQYIGQPILYC